MTEDSLFSNQEENENSGSDYYQNQNKDEMEIPTAAEIKEDNSFPTPGTSIALRNLDWNILEAGDELVRREDAREAQEEARQEERQRILELIDQRLDSLTADEYPPKKIIRQNAINELEELRGEIQEQVSFGETE